MLPKEEVGRNCKLSETIPTLLYNFANCWIKGTENWERIYYGLYLKKNKLSKRNNIDCTSFLIAIQIKTLIAK